MNAGAAVAYVRTRTSPGERNWVQSHLTQALLGERLGGLTQRRISQMERRPDMKLSTLIEVARALDVSPFELLARTLAADPGLPLAGESHCPLCKVLIF